MPTLLGKPDSIAEQIERLEIHYLSNADAEMRFVLLSDWMDSDEPENDDDRLRLDLAQGMIAELNRRHPQTPPLFLMLFSGLYLFALPYVYRWRSGPSA